MLLILILPWFPFCICFCKCVFQMFFFDFFHMYCFGESAKNLKRRKCTTRGLGWAEGCNCVLWSFPSGSYSLGALSKARVGFWIWVDQGEFVCLFYLLMNSGGMNDEVMAFIYKSLWILGVGLKHECMVQQREMREMDGLKPWEHQCRRNAKFP